MAKKCEICAKVSHTGFKVSHSNIKTKRRWSPNIQKVRALINGTPRRVSICTRCLKAGKVQRAL
ncbi:50S ribosomal protein L28 [Anaerobranca gottschalkii]|uniref:Large ribosomal subunit protein bL28 n=1 Tax=Anaerobranca gottschalkii DSM 13577 TaxID=1120990 RepID=A0A1H9YY15_9FIRM|nr:50S ribosomal protein L28 [Anaerobranca gottschalkii]SES74105.1 LSU ribosomal protein L28P [Anaerobranca gottschalkii DSM 13577]